MNAARLLVLLVSLSLLLGGCGDKKRYPFVTGDIVEIDYSQGASKLYMRAYWVEETETQIVLKPIERVRTNIARYTKDGKFDSYDYTQMSKGSLFDAYKNGKNLFYLNSEIEPIFLSKSSVQIITGLSKSIEIIEIEETIDFVADDPVPPKPKPVIEILPPPPVAKEKVLIDALIINLTDNRFYKKNSNTPYTGFAERYHENGKIQSNRRIIEGLTDGKFHSWWKNGKLSYSGIWVKGQEIERTIYDKSGDIIE